MKLLRFEASVESLLLRAAPTGLAVDCCHRAILIADCLEPFGIAVECAPGRCAGVSTSLELNDWISEHIGHMPVWARLAVLVELAVGEFRADRPHGQRVSPRLVRTRLHGIRPDWAPSHELVELLTAPVVPLTSTQWIAPVEATRGSVITFFAGGTRSLVVGVQSDRLSIALALLPEQATNYESLAPFGDDANFPASSRQLTTG